MKKIEITSKILFIQIAYVHIYTASVSFVLLRGAYRRLYADKYLFIKKN